MRLRERNRWLELEPMAHVYSQQQPLPARRAHRGLPARPLNKENIAWSAVARSKVDSGPSVASRNKPDSAAAELAHFSGFVRLLASKDEAQRAIIMQRAMQQAATISSAISSGRLGLASVPSLMTADSDTGAATGFKSAGLRRAASADELRHPQKAQTGAHEASASRAIARAWLSSPPRQRRIQESKAKERLAARRQLEQAARMTAAATCLQAHWRGRQHRRVARFLRARGRRLRRLEWLDHLEFVTWWLQAQAATTRLQSAWRASRVSTLQPRRRPSAPRTSLAPNVGAVHQPAGFGAQQEQRPRVMWADAAGEELSEVRLYQIDRRPPVSAPAS